MSTAARLARQHHALAPARLYQAVPAADEEGAAEEEEQGDWWEENPDEVDSRGSGHRYTTFQIFTEWFHRLLAGAILGPLVLINWYLIRKSEGCAEFSNQSFCIQAFHLHLQSAIHLSHRRWFWQTVAWVLTRR